MLRRSLLMLVLVASPLLGQTANQLPTLEQLKGQLDTNPQEVLRGVARLIALKGAAAQQYDRYELFSIRGEGSLRTKAMPAAAEAFAAAAKETTDPAKKATARATEILIRKSKPTGYIPKPPKVTPAPASTKPFMSLIPIIKEEDRKMAMEALFTDELAAAGPKIKAADNAQALPPIIEAAKLLGDLNAVETTAFGNAAQSKQIAENVGKRAHFMIDSALKKMSDRTEEIWNSASRKQYTEDKVGNRDYQPGLLGLTSVESNALKDVMATCDKITPVTTDLATVTASPELSSDATASQKLRARAQEVLEYDYPNAGRYTKHTQQPQQQPPPQQPPKRY